ncbi:unnamed protein product [Rhizophagus irregularis]|nr:unnamed protein product [Rhizophagus irregularis]
MTRNWTRNSSKEVALKCLNNLRNDINRFLSELSDRHQITTIWYPTRDDVVSDGNREIIDGTLFRGRNVLKE